MHLRATGRKNDQTITLTPPSFELFLCSHMLRATTVCSNRWH